MFLLLHVQGSVLAQTNAHNATRAHESYYHNLLGITVFRSFFILPLYRITREYTGCISAQL